MTRITFSGQLTEPQFTEMQWLGMHWLVRYLGWIILGAMIVTMAGGYKAVVEDPIGQAVRAIPALLFMGFMFVVPRRAIRKHWRSNALIKGAVHGTVDDVGIDWNSPFITGHFPWEALHRTKRGRDMILVYSAPNSVLYFPRNFFGEDAEWQAFGQLASSRLKSMK